MDHRLFYPALPTRDMGTRWGQRPQRPPAREPVAALPMGPQEAPKPRPSAECRPEKSPRPFPNAVSKSKAVGKAWG